MSCVEKPIWIGHILRRKNCILHDAIEEQMTEEEEHSSLMI
jgi:hypothetical protein